MPAPDWVPIASAAVVAIVVGVGTTIVWKRWRRDEEHPSDEAVEGCSDSEVLAAVAAVREEYDLSETGGFLPSFCLQQLPSAFDAWEAIARNMVALNRSERFRDAIDTMPELDAAALFETARPEELRRSYLLLGMFAHSYVHGHDVPWEVLNNQGEKRPETAATSPATSEIDYSVVPPQLARPWFEICRRLKMPPVLTAGATDLWNWRLVNAKLPHTLGNIELTTSLSGTSTETNFHMVPCAMQAAAADIIPKIFLADILVRGARTEQLTMLLRELTHVLKKFRDIFAFGTSGVDKDTFYDVYRPLLDGFFPDGVILAGVDASAAAAAAEDLGVEVAPISRKNGGLDAVCAKSKGPSAGQSTMILLFDIFLGVTHCPIGAKFQKEMLIYMPEPHRRMVHDYREKWRDMSSVRQFVFENAARQGGKALASSFEACVMALHDLRRFHLATVTRYLTRTSTGTGASTWRHLLQEILTGTEGACLSKNGCPR